MIRKINLLHLDYDDFENPYAGGGQAKATYEMYSRMTNKYNIQIITGNYPKAKNLSKGKIFYKRVGIGVLGRTASIFSFWLFAPIYAFIYQSRFDLISEFFTAPIGPTLLPVLVKKPVVSWASFLDPEKMASKHNIPFDKVANLLIKHYRYLVGLTESAKKVLLKKNPNAKVWVIPRGIDDKTLRMKSIDKGYALCIGRIDIFNKGVDTIVYAWEEVIKKNPKAKLIIAGNGKEEDENFLIDLIKKHKLDKNIDFVGRVVGNEKDKLLAGSSIVINGTKFGYFGNVALEALAAGKTLVCFDIDGFDWIPDDLCVKVKPFNSKALAKALESNLKDKDKRDLDGRKARKFARNFSWKNVIKKTEIYYNEILEEDSK